MTKDTRDYAYFNAPQEIHSYVQKAYEDGFREGEIEGESKSKKTINEFVALRKFFHKGSPLTEMFDKIITENNLI